MESARVLLTCSQSLPSIARYPFDILQQNHTKSKCMQCVPSVLRHHQGEFCWYFPIYYFDEISRGFLLALTRIVL